MGIPWRAGREAAALHEGLAQPGAEWEGGTLTPARPIVQRASATAAGTARRQRQTGASP